MDDQKNIDTQNQNLNIVHIEAKGGQHRWAAITAMLLAVGAILRLISPGVAGISPNWIITMYCLSILLYKPSLLRAAGIGLVAGALSLATSKSIFPYANIISETAGAVVCALLVKLPFSLRIGNFNFKPALYTALATLTSGLSFVTIAKLALNIPTQLYLYGMIPVVFTVTIVGAVISQVLYYPAARLLKGEQTPTANTVPASVGAKEEN